MDENTPKPKKKGFFRALFKGINTLRLIIINIIFFIIFFAFLGVMGAVPAGKKKMPKEITDNCVLSIRPMGIASESETMIFSIPISGFDNARTVLISDLTKAIKNATYDGRITALYLDFSNLRGISSGHLMELGEALAEFKNSKKPIYVYSATYSIATYFLASYADRIGLDPFGRVSFEGFASRPIFFKGMEAKFGIKWNVLQAGAFKGMAEMYSKEKLSDNVRSNLKELYNNLWQKYLTTVSSNKKIPLETIKNFAENYSNLVKKYSGDMAIAALKEGLVTDIGSYTEFLSKIEFIDKNSYNELVDAISYEDYNLNFIQFPGQNNVGVIYLEGAISSVATSADRRGVASSSKIVKLFDRALDDKTVKAVVLRVDSGGGEVFASEEIRRAVQKAKAKNIPVVVSMGAVAASGAYWISSCADYIFASPYTITGSIGVLGTMPSFQKALKEHLGITSDMVFAGQKPAYSSFQDITAEEKQTRRLEISDIYKKFIQIVSNGRNLKFNTVANFAGGKVYSGEQALKLQLVDDLGSFSDATKYAAKLAGIEHSFSVKTIKKPLTATENLLKSFMENIDAGIIEQLPVADINAVFEFLQLNQKAGFYVYTPERLIWE